MSSTLEYYQRTPMRRSQRQKYYVRESPISFLDESYDREQHVVLGGKDRASRRQRPLYDNALERSAPEIESYPLVEYGSFIHLVMTHSFRFSVLAIVVCFLAQTPIGLATLLLFLLAISSLYFYINSVESTSRRYTKAYGSEALYRGKSPDYLLRGSSSEYEEDSEYSEDSEDSEYSEDSEDSEDSEYSEDSEDSEGYPVDVADPNHGNPAWPRRTFIEAISDTVPRMVFGFFAFLSSAFTKLSTMKPTITIVLASLLTITSAHSWLHCTSFNNTDLIKWMEGNATESNGKMILDPIFPEWAHLCSGFSRYKANPGNWINESSAYAWSPSIHNSTHACHPDQRAPIQLLKFNETGHSDHYNPAPMATARAGGSIKLMFGGNGHSRGDFGGVQKSGPGMVRVYWKGGVEREIVRVRELTKKNLLQENGFAEESYVWPPDKNVTKAPAMKDKGNWQTVWLPKGMEPGRHMMVWVWSIQGDQPSWTTCFDVMIEE
ncbi:predicted protein [Pyrenophora tritici-repentis Pt-1C-BFP]|uniref:Uncharacterized protein n=2 Tax=Pyrenophora tritici-repentis TaxID=45151 RepID=B2WKS9_PYRTR|nr:uncharacterized protein PTRG_10589 [Pyrenophora tritici-repentis Pt-1C-BFP]EDU43639.1 predicted protein [Pyrenophora tritici-repentis Pt-1C-BFP]